MLTYFPNFFSTRAIGCYLITLALVSFWFSGYVMPFQFMLFGFVAVLVFFIYSNKLTMEWRRFSTKTFVKKLFVTALVIRLAYVIFIYFYYIEMTGVPHAFHVADEIVYLKLGEIWRNQGFDEMRREMSLFVLSDKGYGWYLGFVNMLFGTHVLTARILKCFLGAFSCVLMYNMAKRNFGEWAGRITGIFCMLMPNMWFYCGVTLKELEMAFLVILYAERTDYVLHARKIVVKDMLIPVLCILAAFTFRTALGGVLFASFAVGLVFTSKKQLKLWQKILYSSVFAIWMAATVGVEIVQETQQLWEDREDNQSAGMEARANRAGGNQFAKYASATLFAPAIFTIPFSSMVYIENQENQMMLNGGNFIKNVLSGLTIYALFLLLLSGDWRKHVLPIALTCGYLLVIAFSNFAHSERFHFPVLAFELMFAAYGVTQVKNKQKKWYTYWLIGVTVMILGWSWIKLAGRGFV